MQIRILLANLDHEQGVYFKDVDLPYLPTEDMWLDMGRLENGDLIAGSATRHEHSFITDVTAITCVTNCTDEELREFARIDGWQPIDE